MTQPNDLPNPYVGPRAFEEAEESRFFGREREREKLYHLLLARRLVLLPAPSGAGKSSLVRAGMIPRLRQKVFLVRPVIRVGAEAASGSACSRFSPRSCEKHSARKSLTRPKCSVKSERSSFGTSQPGR